MAKTGLPWWLCGEEPFCQGRKHGFDPWSRKIPHAVEQLSPCTTPMVSVFQSPRAATPESACGRY